MSGVGRYGTLLDAIHGVRWPARKTVHTGSAGTHTSRQLGLAAEFTAYRPYRQGDDPRHLDWKLLARTDRAYQRISVERATLRTILIVDASASMDFPETAPTKWTRACEVAVGLAAIAQSAGDPVGLLVAGAETGFRPRTRRGIVGQIAAILDGIRPDGDADLEQVLRHLEGRGRVALLSDCLDEGNADIIAAGRALTAAGAEVTVVHVVAAEELEPGTLPFDAVDPEATRARRPLSEAGLPAYRRAFAAWRDDLARAWRESGAAYTLVRTDEAADRAIRRIVEA